MLSRTEFWLAIGLGIYLYACNAKDDVVFTILSNDSGVDAYSRDSEPSDSDSNPNVQPDSGVDDSSVQTNSLCPILNEMIIYEPTCIIPYSTQGGTNSLVFILMRMWGIEISDEKACEPYRRTWYFNDENNPTQIILCTYACTQLSDFFTFIKDLRFYLGCVPTLPEQVSVD